MQLNAVINAIRKAGEIISGQYFLDPFDLENTPCCAIGALIKDLPKSKLPTVLEEIRSEGALTATINLLPATLTALSEHYGCTGYFLLYLQHENDKPTYKIIPKSKSDFLRKRVLGFVLSSTISDKGGLY